MKRIYLGIDIGGTNLRVYEVNTRTGTIPELENGAKSCDSLTRDLKSNRELTDIVMKRIQEISSGKLHIGISSAGDIDEEKLIVKYSPNMGIKRNINLAKILSLEGHKVTLTNDMRAALAGTIMWGDGKNYENVLVATYSSGHNVAKAERKKIVTKAEIGHEPYSPRIILPDWAKNISCGCGGKGHLEPYVSGNGAVVMLANWCKYTGKKPKDIFEAAIEDKKEEKRKRFKRKLEEVDRTNAKKLMNLISARDIYEAYRNNPNDSPQRQIREIQMHSIADSFGMFVSAYNPLDIIVCMGSQTKDWEILFDPAIEIFRENPQDYHLPSLNQPKIVRNSVRKLGVVGAVAYHILQNKD